MNRIAELLWSPKYPNLVEAQLTLMEGDQVLDDLHSYAALRSVGFSDGRFMLNGSPYYLRMVLEQGYWPESHRAAPSGEALMKEVELIKSLGFNGARIHQKVEDPRFILTECGGISYALIHGKPWYGYGTVQDQGAYLAKYKELITAILDSPVIAGYCYTQLTDTQQETNGLLDAQRKPKLPVDDLYAINTRHSKAVPGEQLQNAQLASGSVDTIS